jgi:hypothetical protein
MIDVRPVRFVLTSEVWESQRTALVDQRRYVTGPLRSRSGLSHDGEAIVEVLADRAELVAEVPTGLGHNPLDDFYVLTVRHDDHLTAETLLERIDPRPSQTVVVLVFDAHDHRRWDGIVFREERTQPLAGFQVVGGGMLSVDRPTDRSVAAAVDLPTAGANSRLLGAVGDFKFRKLKRAVVTLIGASRTGTLAAQYLAALGIARLRLCDPDRVSLENLDGMPGVPRIAVGEFKTHALADVLLLQRPDLSVTCCERSILDPEAAGLFASRSDLIVTCVDNDTARTAAGLHARRQLVPHLDLAASVEFDQNGERRYFADARLLLPGQGCVFCVAPPSAAERNQILYELAAPDGSLRRGSPLEWHQQRAGSLITLNALVVSAGITAWLDLLGGRLRTSFWQRLDWIPGNGLAVQVSGVGPDKNCFHCKS